MASKPPPAHEPFEDAVLGWVTRNAPHKEWVFAVVLPSGRNVRGRIVPVAWELPLSEQGLTEIRDRVRSIRNNEADIRRQIAESMFEGWLSGWYDDEIDRVSTKDEFRETISLTAIDVLEDRLATLTYDDGNLFGGHALVLTLGPDGEFRRGPVLFG